jgi:hypothetical protein
MVTRVALRETRSMDSARKIASGDELRAIAAAGTGFIVDPFTRRWHLAACPHIHAMRTGQPKWFARSRDALDDYMQQRLAQYPTAKLISACATCGSRVDLTPPAVAEPRPWLQEANLPADHAVNVRDALRQIIFEHGPAALSRPAQLANLLKDLLPGEPAVTRMLAAAAEERVAWQLREHVSAGLDGATAARLAASSFASRNRYDSGTCAWLIGELATALGLIGDTGNTPTVPATPP